MKHYFELLKDHHHSDTYLCLVGECSNCSQKYRCYTAVMSTRKDGTVLIVSVPNEDTISYKASENEILLEKLLGLPTGSVKHDFGGDDEGL